MKKKLLLIALALVMVLSLACAAACTSLADGFEVDPYDETKTPVIHDENVLPDVHAKAS